MAKIIFHPAADRGHADHGWLNAWHSFSFAGWYDASKIHFGALRVLNDDTVSGGMGFGKHPHDNMEIITVVLQGALEHKDSMGNTGSIQAGEVQVMSAGTGVFHSEFNHNPDEAVKLFQLWIFPEEKNLVPRYDQRAFDETERINQLQTLVSPMNKEDEGLKIHQQAWIYRTQLEAGKSLTLSLHTRHHGAYIMNMDGEIKVEGKDLQRRDAIGVSDTKEISIEAVQDSEILLIEVPMIN